MTETEIIEKTEEEKMEAEIKIRQNVILKALTEQHPHLLDYLVNNFDEEIGIPMYIEKLDRKHKKLQNPNVLYPAGGPVFIHVYPGKKGRNIYSPVEPALNPQTASAQEKILAKLTELIRPIDIPKTKAEHINLYDQFVNISPDIEKVASVNNYILQLLSKSLTTLNNHFWSWEMLEDSAIKTLIMDSAEEILRGAMTTEDAEKRRAWAMSANKTGLMHNDTVVAIVPLYKCRFKTAAGV